MLELQDTMSGLVEEYVEIRLPFLDELMESLDEPLVSPIPRSAMPIDFIYDMETKSYDLSKFGTDQELMERI